MKVSTQIIIGLTLMCAYVQAQHSHSHGETDTHKPSGKKQKEMHAPQAPAKFQEQLNELFVSSLKLKDTFIDSDVSKVRASATEVKNSVSKADFTLLKEELLMDWMGLMKKLNESLDMIANSEDIAVERKSFPYSAMRCIKASRLSALAADQHTMIIVLRRIIIKALIGSRMKRKLKILTSLRAC